MCAYLTVSVSGWDKTQGVVQIFKKICQHNHAPTHIHIHTLENAMPSRSKLKCVLTDVTSVVKTVEHFIYSKRPQVIPERHKNIEVYTAVWENSILCLFLTNIEKTQRVLITILNLLKYSKGKRNKK